MLSNPSPSANEADLHAQSYVYPPPLVQGAGPKPPSAPGSPSTLERLWTPDATPAASSAVNEDQIRARETRARKEGRDEGVAQTRGEYEKKLADERQALVQAIRQFALERQTYFHRVEAEVVSLALAIARKILHREAQVDPLLLAGVVRVGLDNTAAGMRVRLRVNPGQIRAWQEFFSLQTDLQSLPELLGDATLGPGRCVLETDLGSTDLTLETQLKEIEQGFFDLLAQRPKEQ